MFDEFIILFYFLGFFDGDRKLQHPVSKLLVFSAIIGFSDTWSAFEEKRTDDDKKVMEAEDSIHCILNRLWYSGVEIGHFSNSIFHTVIYGQIDSYDSSRDWCQIDVASPLPSYPKFPFTRNPGIKRCVGDYGDPLEYFNLYLHDETFSFILGETNRYAESFFENTELTPASRAL
ncbi:piggyBac transposable element-derived protein 4 [Trichonephila clavipes]|nr:piggyBac transposable element-derived protein 4 [Trichonephila clavipes]